MKEDKYLITRERTADLTPGYWNIESQTAVRIKRIFDIDVNKIWLHFKSGILIQFYINRHWNKAGEILADKMYEDKKFLKNLEREMKKAEKLINVFLIKNKKTDYNKLSFNELIKAAETIKKLWLNYDNLNVPTWYIGGEKFKEKIANYLKLPEDDFLFLTTPKIKTAVSQLERELLNAAILIKKNKKELIKIADKLSKDYGWIPFGYDGPEFWGKKYFINKLKKEIRKDLFLIEKKIEENIKKEKEDKQKREYLAKKYKLNKNKFDLIDKMNLLAVWTDERKKLEFQLHYFYAEILKEFEKRYSIPYKNLKYLFTEELTKIKNNKKRILEISNARINKDFIIEFSSGKGRILPEKRKKYLLNEIKKLNNSEKINGVVACRGRNNVYKGIVKILLSPKESKKIKKGDFLVATMTTPDYIVSMNMAAGFITDEGGITCHAAIVAREMQKPCIIGTRIATKILKDGDLVEVDADKGVVEIIKRKKQP